MSWYGLIVPADGLANNSAGPPASTVRAMVIVPSIGMTSTWHIDAGWCIDVSMKWVTILSGNGLLTMQWKAIMWT